MILKFAFLIPFLNLIPLTIGGINWITFKSKKAKLFKFYLNSTAICGLFCIALGHIGKSNLWCYNCLQILIFIVLSVIFHIEFRNRLIIVVSSLTTVFLIINTNTHGFFNFNQVNFNIAFTFIGFMSALCLKEAALNAIEPKIKEYDFWMHGGFFVFSFGSLFLNLFFRNTYTNDFILKFYILYQFTLNLIVNIIFTKSISLLKSHGN